MEPGENLKMDDCLIITENRVVVYGCSFVASELENLALKNTSLDLTFYRIFINDKYIWFWLDFRKVSTPKLVDELEKKFWQKLKIRNQKLYDTETVEEKINRINRVYSATTKKPKKRNSLQKFFDYFR